MNFVCFKFEKKMLLFIKVAIFYCICFIVISYNSTNGISSILSKISNVIFCNRIFLEDDIDEFLDNLKIGIKGQPFVNNNILPAIRSHFKRNPDGNKPRGPLVFRFHGPVGVGKSLVADKFMRLNFFMNKNFIHVKAASLLDTPSKIDKYKAEVKELIETSVKHCGRAVFIFDDVNEVASNIFLSLPPFQRNPYIDYSESVFIYISQMNSEDIETATINLLEHGVSRKDFTLEQFIELLQMISSKKDSLLGRLWSGVVTLWGNKEEPSHDAHEVYIPFLPLDVFTVTTCIKKEAEELKIKLSKRMINEIIMQVGCPSTEESDLCSSGCKLVSSKLPLVLAEHDEL